MPHTAPFHRLITPPGTPYAEQVLLGLLMCALLALDHGAASARDGFTTYTCSLGILEGGRN